MAKTATKKRTGARAPKIVAPYNRGGAAEYERTIGRALVRYAKIQAELAERVQMLEEQFAPLLKKAENEALLYGKALYQYATKCREELTENDARKTVTLGTAGVVRWYDTPKAVSISRTVKNEKLIAELKALDLTRFIRIKEEPDKEAMLKEPEVANSVNGVSIGTQEKFAIIPKGKKGRLERSSKTGKWKVVSPREESEEAADAVK